MIRSATDGKELLSYEIGPYEVDEDLVLDCEVTGGQNAKLHTLPFYMKLIVSSIRLVLGHLIAGISLPLSVAAMFLTNFYYVST